MGGRFVMSLKVIVVGRCEVTHTVVCHQHELTFVESARIDDKIMSIKCVDFVLLHLSPANPEGRDAARTWIGESEQHKIVGIVGGGEIPRDWKDAVFPVLVGLADQSSVKMLAW